MVQATYDIFNRQETPPFILCNPDSTELYSLDSATKKEVVRRFNAISEVNIEMAQQVNGVEIPSYDYLKQKRLIFVDDNESGYYVIVDVKENSDGIIKKKVVKGLSIDFNLVNRKLVAFGGTYSLYDVLAPEDSLLGAILEYIPSWSIGEVDSELLTKYRTFDVANSNIYEFLVTDVEEAYNCIILFDTISKTVSARTLDNITTDTDLFMSHDNLLKSSSFKEISDELATALTVVGGGNLSINAVNPLGTNIIYDFSYYKDGDGWMSSGLISALGDWEVLIAANQTTYADTLTATKIANEELVVLNGELDTLDAEYLALEGVRLVQIEADPDVDLSAINVLIDAKQVEIDSKTTQVTNKESEIESLRGTLESINDTLSFDNNFTTAQLEELDGFTTENSWQNETLVQLDSDTPDIIQEQAQILYNQGIDVLERVSQPKYEFTVSSIDLLSLKEFESVSDQLELGSIVHMENASEQQLQLILLEIKKDYMEPGQFNLVFSNRLRLANGAFIYSDLFGKAIKSGTKVSYDAYKWGNWQTHKNDVTTFITSNLDASVNALINGDNEELLINENGLRLRKWDEIAEDYDPAELWLSSKSLMFTTDSWNTASLGLGRITHDGSDVYGIIGETIVGEILAGNELRIANDANNFTLDQNGASLVDASFELTTTNGYNRITIEPTLGILIESDIGGAGVWSDSFYVDTSGNVIFAGNLSGASGSFSGSITATEGFIGGMEITSDGIDVDSTHYIHNDGEIKWGGLWLRTDGTAVFDGDIYASKLNGTVDWSQIINTPIPTSQFNGGTGYSAGGITTGTMNGGRIYGGEMEGSGVEISLGGKAANRLNLHGDSAVFITNNSGDGVYVSGGWIIADASYFRASGFSYLNGGVSIDGNVYVDGNLGISTAYSIQTSGGYRTFTWRRGILIAVS